MPKPLDLAAALAAATDRPAVDITLEELVHAYCVATCDGTDLRLRKWMKAFGHESAWAIKSERLEAAAQAMLNHGYESSTVNRDLSSLGSVYRWAKARRLTPRGFQSPTVGVRRYEEKIRRVHVEREQLEALRARALAWPDRRFGVLVALLMDTGARKSELLDRCWAEVDLDRQEILAPTTKNGTPRVLFFSEATQALIARVYPPAARQPDRMLFEGRVQGSSISYRKAWLATTKDVGVEGLRLHDLRHVAAANLLRAGVTLGVAAQVLGHDPAVLARRYGHLETDALRRAQHLAWGQQIAG